MITGVSGKNFKGVTFNDALSRRNIFIGPNGSGKSTRSHAATLALLGYIPGTAKTNQAVMDAYGSGQTMTVGVRVGPSDLFERRFYRSKSGSVSQTLRHNKTKASKEDWISWLANVGGPNILDLGLFLRLSDEKKIAEIFRLFPSAGNVNELDAKIEKAAEKRNRLQQEVREDEKAAAKLTKARTEMELPAGTLAEVQAEIEKTRESLIGAREELKLVEIEQAKSRAAEKAKQEAEEAARKKAEELERSAAEQNERAKQALADIGLNPASVQITGPEAIKIPEKDVEKALRDLAKLDHEIALARSNADIRMYDPAESMQVILNTLNEVGCSACAVRLVTLRELKKFQPTERGG